MQSENYCLQRNSYSVKNGVVARVFYAPTKNCDTINGFVHEKKPRGSKGPEKEINPKQPEPYSVLRDSWGRFMKGTQYLPISAPGLRQQALKAFLDDLNGLAGEKRLMAIARIAEGEQFTTAEGTNITPSIREQLDANLVLLYLQHGKPTQTQVIDVNQTTRVRWDPDKYTNVKDLERYLELQQIGEGSTAKRLHTANEPVVDVGPTVDAEAVDKSKPE